MPQCLDRELEREQLRAHAMVYARAKGISLEQATEALEARSLRTRRKHSLPLPLPAPGSQQGSPKASQVRRGSWGGGGGAVCAQARGMGVTAELTQGLTGEEGLPGRGSGGAE